MTAEPQVLLTVGTLPSPNLNCLAASHPFTQQVDVLFSSSEGLENALKVLTTCYVKTTARLSDMVRNVEELARRTSVPVPGPSHSGEHRHPRTMAVLSVTPPIFDDDRWCIDDSGVLTLNVCTETYRRLGLVGTKVQSAGKKRGERRVIEASLLERGQSVDTPERRQESLKAWDARREDEDRLGAWEVLYHGPSTDTTEKFAAEKGHTVREVECQIQRSFDVFIPSTISFTPSLSLHDSEDEDDWNSNVSAMLEWVGMAILGAQRLAANDRVDPFVAVVEPPTPSRIGNLTRLRWRGLLSPSFVQSVIDTSATVLSTMATTGTDSGAFVAIVCQTSPSTPVSYIPAFELKGGRKGTRVQRDCARGSTWCVVLANGDVDDSAKTWGTWLKADNLGS